MNDTATDDAVVEQALAALHTAVDGLLALDFEVAPPLALSEVLRGVELERRRLDAVDVSVTAALATQATPSQFGATSLPDLVGGLTRTSRSEARARAQRSLDLAPRRALTGEALEPIHPRTAAALAAGEISGAHADVIVRYLGRLPATVTVELFAMAEAYLVEAARHEDPATLCRSGNLLLARLDPDGAEPRDEEQNRGRRFGIGSRRGPNDVHGQLTDETKAVWQAIFDSLAAPRPAEDGTPDERNAGQRAHDALLEAGLRLLRSGSLPDNGGVPVSVVVRVDAADLGTVNGGRADPVGDPVSAAASDADRGRDAEDGAGSESTGDHERSRTSPGSGGSRGESGAIAQTAHGDVVSLERFLRLADQADITTVVLSAAGGVVDYGRTRRFATCEMRRALTARDGGCCFPACTRPAAWTEAHHIVPWVLGGETKLENLCLLCAHHHRTFEGAGWRVDMINGVPQWTPPAWLDPARRRRRNTAQHLPDIAFDYAV